MQPHVERPLRSDAERNRRRILEVAEDVFSRQGLDAPMEDIAAEVGVGVGTIYRRFGSKAALVSELYEQRLDDYLGFFSHYADQPTAWAGLCEVMRFSVRAQAENRALQQVLFTNVDTAAALLRARVEPVLADLVERAKAEGALRPDFAATDIPILTQTVSALAHRLPGNGVELAERHLELLLKGLRATPDEHPVPPPLGDEYFADWLLAMAR